MYIQVDWTREYERSERLRKEYGDKDYGEFGHIVVQKRFNAISGKHEWVKWGLGYLMEIRNANMVREFYFNTVEEFRQFMADRGIQMSSTQAYQTANTHFSWPYSTAFQNDFGEPIVEALTENVELPIGLPIGEHNKINKLTTRKKQVKLVGKKQVKPKTCKNPVKAKTAKNAK